MAAEQPTPRVRARLLWWLALAACLTPLALAGGLDGGVDGENPVVRRDAGRYGAHREAYVGYAPEAFDPARGHDPRRVEAAVDAWLSEHPHRRVVARDPVVGHGVVLGYRVVVEVAAPTAPGALPYHGGGGAGGDAVGDALERVT